MSTPASGEETLEEIAARIAKQYPSLGTQRAHLRKSVLSALCSERKRAVDIARGEDCGLLDCLCAARIAATIRGGE